MSISTYSFLGVSIITSICVMSNSYIVECSNLVGMKCLIDLCFEKKKDMILHHVLVVALVHYLNQHNKSEYIKEMTTLLLSTECSTIFYMLNDLLKNSVVKKVNKMAFISTFYYYRIYSYSYFLLYRNVNVAILIHSRNNFEYYEIYFGIYGLYLLNLYWGTLILKKCITLINKNDS